MSLPSAGKVVRLAFVSAQEETSDDKDSMLDYWSAASQQPMVGLLLACKESRRHVLSHKMSVAMKSKYDVIGRSYDYFNIKKDILFCELGKKTLMSNLINHLPVKVFHIRRLAIDYIDFEQKWTDPTSDLALFPNLEELLICDVLRAETRILVFKEYPIGSYIPRYMLETKTMAEAVMKAVASANPKRKLLTMKIGEFEFHKK
jgi:hypothetical protein